MALILSLETSTENCSVALHDDGKLVALSESLKEKSHAEKIILLIKNCFEIAGKSLHQTDAIAVSKGPGSYTGLRIASSTAKGLCFALDKPLIGVNTLQALAYQYRINGFLICPTIDARRMEIYYGLYDENNKNVKPDAAEIIDKQFLHNYLKENKVLFIGNGANKCSEVISHPNAYFHIDSKASAASVGTIAELFFKEEWFENLELFEPNYLKEFYTTFVKSNTQN
ncbi:MAG: tRNA (adenosine(37)-N6)-threonylcarbamoyltransferase complex dimerization subunit type 1 TsaB [Bacteroidota bacterium]|nr:tRNA (adenosine(37)-N6)-threonylcarbamoyltransferase complex dimerization subunit type 1 TsaB [Bacteroidota bacterium]